MSLPTPMTLLQVKYIQQGNAVYKVLVPQKDSATGDDVSPKLLGSPTKPIICHVQDINEFNQQCSSEYTKKPQLMSMVDLSSQYHSVKSLVRLHDCEKDEGASNTSLDSKSDTNCSENTNVCVDLNLADTEITPEPCEESGNKNNTESLMKSVNTGQKWNSLLSGLTSQHSEIVSDSSLPLGTETVQLLPSSLLPSSLVLSSLAKTNISDVESNTSGETINSNLNAILPHSIDLPPKKEDSVAIENCTSSDLKCDSIKIKVVSFASSKDPLVQYSENTTELKVKIMVDPESTESISNLKAFKKQFHSDTLDPKLADSNSEQDTLKEKQKLSGINKKGRPVIILNRREINNSKHFSLQNVKDSALGKVMTLKGDSIEDLVTNNQKIEWINSSGVSKTPASPNLFMLSNENEVKVQTYGSPGVVGVDPPIFKKYCPAPVTYDNTEPRANITQSPIIVPVSKVNPIVSRKLSKDCRSSTKGIKPSRTHFVNNDKNTFFQRTISSSGSNLKPNTKGLCKVKGIGLSPVNPSDHLDKSFITKQGTDTKKIPISTSVLPELFLNVPQLFSKTSQSSTGEIPSDGKVPILNKPIMVNNVAVLPGFNKLSNNKCSDAVQSSNSGVSSAKQATVMLQIINGKLYLTAKKLAKNECVLKIVNNMVINGDKNKSESVTSKGIFDAENPSSGLIVEPKVDSPLINENGKSNSLNSNSKGSQLQETLPNSTKEFGEMTNETKNPVKNSVNSKYPIPEIKIPDSCLLMNPFQTRPTENQTVLSTQNSYGVLNRRNDLGSTMERKISLLRKVVNRTRVLSKPQPKEVPKVVSQNQNVTLPLSNDVDSVQGQTSVQDTEAIANIPDNVQVNVRVKKNTKKKNSKKVKKSNPNIRLKNRNRKFSSVQKKRTNIAKKNLNNYSEYIIKMDSDKLPVDVTSLSGISSDSDSGESSSSHGESIILHEKSISRFTRKKSSLADLSESSDSDIESIECKIIELKMQLLRAHGTYVRKKKGDGAYLASESLSKSQKILELERRISYYSKNAKHLAQRKLLQNMKKAKKFRSNNTEHMLVPENINSLIKPCSVKIRRLLLSDPIINISSPINSSCLDTRFHDEFSDTHLQQTTIKIELDDPAENEYFGSEHTSLSYKEPSLENRLVNHILEDSVDIKQGFKSSEDSNSSEDYLNHSQDFDSSFNLEKTENVAQNYKSQSDSQPSEDTYFEKPSSSGLKATNLKLVRRKRRKQRQLPKECPGSSSKRLRKDTTSLNELGNMIIAVPSTSSSCPTLYQWPKKLKSSDSEHEEIWDEPINEGQTMFKSDDSSSKEILDYKISTLVAESKDMIDDTPSTGLLVTKLEQPNISEDKSPSIETNSKCDLTFGMVEGHDNYKNSPSTNANLITGSPRKLTLNDCKLEKDVSVHIKKCNRISQPLTTRKIIFDSSSDEDIAMSTTNTSVINGTADHVWQSDSIGINCDSKDCTSNETLCNIERPMKSSVDPKLSERSESVSEESNEGNQFSSTSEKYANLLRLVEKKAQLLKSYRQRVYQ